MHNNKRFWFRKGILFFLLFVAGILLFGLVLMKLWNAILIPVLHVSAITFWQALGIFILAKILFGGFRGGWGGRRGYRMHALQQKFANMTPEEREKFKAEWRNRCNK
jgi:Ca2+/H+ antiporter, TMEM165/GDT1 family